MLAESQLVWLDTRTAPSPVSQCLDSAFQDLTLHDDDTLQKSYEQSCSCGTARVIMLLSHCRSGWAWVINSNFARRAPHVDCRLNPARRTQVIDAKAASESDFFVDALRTPFFSRLSLRSEVDRSRLVRQSGTRGMFKIRGQIPVSHPRLGRGPSALLEGPG